MPFHGYFRRPGIRGWVSQISLPTYVRGRALSTASTQTKAVPRSRPPDHVELHHQQAISLWPTNDSFHLVNPNVDRLFLLRLQGLQSLPGQLEAYFAPSSLYCWHWHFRPISSRRFKAAEEELSRFVQAYKMTIWGCASFASSRGIFGTYRSAASTAVYWKA